MKAISEGSIWGYAKISTFSEFKNWIHKFFRNTPETEAKEEMFLMDSDDYVSMNEIQELVNFFSGTYIDKKFIIDHLDKLKKQ